MQDVNLIPPYRRDQKSRRRRLRFWCKMSLAYLLLLGSVLGTAHAVWAGDGNTLAKRQKTMEDRVDQMQRSIVTLRKQLALCREQLQANDTLLHQPDWSRLLHLTAEAQGEDIVLQRCGLVTLNTRDVSVVETVLQERNTAPTDAVLRDPNYEFKLSGFAREQTAVSLFVLRLERLALFDIVRLDKSRRETFLGKPAVAFTVVCRM